MLVNILINFFYRLEFDNQKSRLSNQLEYEQSLDTKQNVTKWREMIRNDEHAIEKNKKEEKNEMKVEFLFLLFFVRTNFCLRFVFFNH